MKNDDLIIVLFDINYKDPFSILCSVVTGSSYSHSAVHIGDTTYDNTFLRGYFSDFDITKEHSLNRELTLIKIKNINGKKWLEEVRKNKNYPLKYDVLGLLLWFFGKHDSKKEYCFETVNNCLTYYGIGVNRKNGRISGKYIIDKFINNIETTIIRTNVKNYKQTIELLRK